MPNDGSTRSSATIFSSRPSSGRMAVLPTTVRVPLVVGVHRHGGVAEHRLRTRRGDGDAAAAGDVVADVVERPGHVPVGHLEVADGRAAARAPVDQVAVLVDVALVVEGDEDAGHGAHVALVEGEALALVVARRAEPLELLDDGAAVLAAPLPHPRHELLAPEVLLGEALLAQHLLDHVLRRDAGVVGAHQPAGVLAEHAVIPREHVLDGVVEGVAHVQHAGDVRRRDDDGVRRPVRVGLGVEEVLVEPVLHPPRLDGGGLEARGLLQVVGAAARVGHGPLSRSAPGRGAEGLRGGWFTRASPVRGLREPRGGRARRGRVESIPGRSRACRATGALTCRSRRAPECVSACTETRRGPPLAARGGPLRTRVTAPGHFSSSGTSPPLYSIAHTWQNSSEPPMSDPHCEQCCSSWPDPASTPGSSVEPRWSGDRARGRDRACPPPP